MTISPIEVYFIMQLDSIRDVTGLLSFFIGISIAASAVVFFLSFDDCFESDGTIRMFMKKISTISLSLFFVLMLIRAFLPSTKQMAAVILIPQIINNEKVQQLPEDILNLVQNLIREWTLQPNDAGHKVNSKI